MRLVLAHCSQIRYKQARHLNTFSPFYHRQLINIFKNGTEAAKCHDLGTATLLSEQIARAVKRHTIHVIKFVIWGDLVIALLKSQH